jgi:hypothetical protein
MKEGKEMFAKKMIWSLTILTIALGSPVIASTVYAKESPLHLQVLDHAGKSYTGMQDPSYLTYDSSLRAFMVDRINKRFGIALDPKTYSGFELLEIEALFKCKKSEESFDLFLKMFPKHP